MSQPPLAAVRPSFSGLLSNIREVDPTRVLAMIKSRIVVEDAEDLLADANTPKAPNTLRVVAISDTHTAHDRLSLPPGDVLVHAGDFTDTGKANEVDAFCAWLRQQTQFQHKVVIAGNHDLSLDERFYMQNYQRWGHDPPCDPREQKRKLESCCTYLDHSGVDISGIRFFGSPYQPEFYDWAFNLSRSGECYEKWSTIPTNTDVLITHGVPLGHNDAVGRRLTEHAGCADLLDWCEKYRPKLCIGGHLHEQWGATTNKHTVFVNASTLNEAYNVNKMRHPIVVDLPLPRASAH